MGNGADLDAKGRRFKADLKKCQWFPGKVIPGVKPQIAKNIGGPGFYPRRGALVPSKKKKKNF